MGERLRTSLAVATTPRQADVDKDTLLRNGYIDISQSGSKYAVKRAGRTLKTSPTTTNRGIFFNRNQNKFFYINSAGTPVEVTL